jgi:NADPH:quinone reductase
MRAIIYERRGPARDVLQIVDRPKPEPDAGEVRVQVAVTAINPTDLKARGQWLGQEDMLFPVVTPHRDAAGIIEKVGANVDQNRLGERVWINLNHRIYPFGTAAEYTTVPEKQAWRLPSNTSFTDGACLGIPVLTAYWALFRDEPIKGKTVLIHGGAGGVGFYAIQLAKWGGADNVITTVSREEQAIRARDAGADSVVNYKNSDVIQQIEKAAGGADSVHHIVEVNLGANADLDAAVIAHRGTIIAYGSDLDSNPRIPFYRFMTKDVILRMGMVSYAPEKLREQAISDIIKLLESDGVKHQIAARFPLEKIIDAHELQETGKAVGKIIIDVADI